MSLSSFPLAVSRNRAFRWLFRLGRTGATSRQYQPLLQAELTEGDLYSQANCLFKAGYREVAIISGVTAIRRNLRRILMVIPTAEQSELPEKTSSWRQYAVYELAYFFYRKGIIDKQLLRDLNGFQKKANRVASGVKMSVAKGNKMIAAINAFRPQLDVAMGRALKTIPAHKRARALEQPEPSVVSAETVVHLTKELAKAIDSWYKRSFGKADLPITDPVVMLVEMRARTLISRKQFKVGCKLFQHPETLMPVHIGPLRGLLHEAQEQVRAEYRRLTDAEKHLAGRMVDEGSSLEEIYERFGITASNLKPAKSRDARQVEHWAGRP